MWLWHSGTGSVVAWALLGHCCTWCSWGASPTSAIPGFCGRKARAEVTLPLFSLLAGGLQLHLHLLGPGRHKRGELGKPRADSSWISPFFSS